MLALDLAISQQSGMSRGLRYLIDRSNRHVVVSPYSSPHQAPLTIL